MMYSQIGQFERFVSPIKSDTFCGEKNRSGIVYRWRLTFLGLPAAEGYNLSAHDAAICSHAVAERMSNDLVAPENQPYIMYQLSLLEYAEMDGMMELYPRDGNTGVTTPDTLNNQGEVTSND